MDQYLPDEEFTLEDIIREFGSGPDTPPPEPVLPGMESSDVEILLPDVPDEQEDPSDASALVDVSEVPETSAKKQRIRKHHQKRDIRKSIIEIDDIYEDDYEEFEDKKEDYTFSLKKHPRRSSVRTHMDESSTCIPTESFAFDEKVKRIREKEHSFNHRFEICVVVTVVNLMLSIYNGLELHWIRGFENIAAMGVISLILLLCAAGVAYDVLLKGLRQAFNSKFGPELLATVLTVIAVPEAVFAVIAGRMPFCAMVSLNVLCALWAERREADTIETISYVLEHSENAVGVKQVNNAWNGKTAAARGSTNREYFESMFGMDNVHQKVMQIYVPLVVCITALLGGLGSILSRISFFWLWTALLLAATPISCFLAYIFPFSLLTELLSRKKAALCGWYGARVLNSCEILLLKDAELFPEGCLRLSGVKSFEQYDSNLLMRYSGAILQAVHCDIASLLIKEYDLLPQIFNLRSFDEEGYGAEIEKHTVLLGTFSFMRKMGVHMEQGAKVRQAIYLSIDGELAGIIALRYEADPLVRRTLQKLFTYDAPLPILVGSDVLVTPKLLRSKFRLPLEHLEFPPLRERMTFSELSAGEDDRQGAIIARPGLPGIGTVCMGARALVTAVYASTVLSILAGIIGIAIVFMLAVSGSLSIVSCSKMFVYALVWVALFSIAAYSVFKS